MTAVILKILHLFKYLGLRVMPSKKNEKFIHELSAMFTCRDGKGGVLSSQASKMLHKPPPEQFI